MPQYDAENAVILVQVYYEGPSAQAKPFADRYYALTPIAATTGSATYPELSSLTYAYNTTARATLFAKFNQLTSTPAFNASFFLFEGYSLAGVKAVPDASTAFAHRQDNLLMSPFVLYFDSALDARAVAAGTELRQLLLASSDEPERLRAYVNYAHGDETAGQMYGFERWRQERLRLLERKYDPHGRFNLHAPIPA